MGQPMQATVDTRSGLTYVRSGEGPPLLLVHGFPLDSSMWNGQFEPLSRASTVIAADLPGFGRSGLGNGAGSIDSYADRLAELLTGPGISSPVVFCGHSMGGYVGWSFLRRHRERVGGMILCHTRSKADSATIARGRRLAAQRVTESGTQALVDDMLLKLVSKATQIGNPEVAIRLQAIMLAAGRDSVSAALVAMAERKDSTSLLAEIDFPVLVVAGEDDPITPAEEMQELANGIRGSTFRLIAGTGHISPMEQPDRFNHLVAEFLAGL